MIGVIAEDGECAIDLLSQHHPRKQMWPGLWTERKPSTRLDVGTVQSVRAPDEKYQIASARIAHRTQLNAFHDMRLTFVASSTAPGAHSRLQIS